MKYVIHIGGPKVGSSSIQRLFSRNPVNNSNDGNPIFYVALRGNDAGSLVFGNQITEFADRTIHGYLNFDFPKIFMDCNQLAAIDKRLEAELPRESTVVLSGEGLINLQIESIRNISDVFADLKIICFIRPYVSYANSAWWQWGAWSRDIPETERFARWKNQNDSGFICRWGLNIERWKAGLGQGSTVQTMWEQNVTHSMLRILDCDLDSEEFANQTPTLAILRVLQKSARLRLTPHDSKVDFVINKMLRGFDSVESNWVLSRTDIQSIHDQCKTDFEVLLRNVSNSLRAQLLLSDEWTNPAKAYAANELVSPSSEDPNPHVLQRVVEFLISSKLYNVVSEEVESANSPS